jgi:pyruvate,water dikinase
MSLNGRLQKRIPQVAIMPNLLNIFRKWLRPKPPSSKEDLNEVFRFKYSCFKDLLASNEDNLNTITDIEQKLQGQQIFGMAYVRTVAARTVFHTLRMIKSLNALSGNRYLPLFDALESINTKVKTVLEQRKELSVKELVLPYSQIDKEKVDWVGGKSANLGEVLSRAHLPIPEGFAITVRAFDAFFNHNDLVDEVNKRKMDLDPNDPNTIALVSEEIQRLIITAQVPPDVEAAILTGYERLRDRTGEDASGTTPRVSMRSSAIGEDAELTHAGQYLSMLNVSADKILQTYKFIVASLYTPRAISYRLAKGVREEDVVMSVAVLRMVESVASGIAYSRHPFNMLNDNIIISAVWGLGPYAVGGVVTPDTYTVTKDGAFRILESKISRKPVQLVCNPDGGLLEIPVPQELQDRPCLTEEQVQTLADYTLKLEMHFKCPQDIEWAIDKEGRILILQSRSLRLDSLEACDAGKTVPVLPGYSLVVDNGAIAYPGVGWGPAYHVHAEDDLLHFPDGAVLVAKQASPKFVIAMQKAQAIVTDSGSVTGHMASLSREFAVPSVLDAKEATAKIPEGALITVDAYSGRVYMGKVPELMSLHKDRESHMQGTPVYETLKSLAEWIVPLHLVEPNSPSFTPQSCKSLHDIMRFVHEVSYSEMFKISDIVSVQAGAALKVDAPIPLDLFVMDLGEGLSIPSDETRKVKVEQIASVPFRAVLKGMMHKDLQTQAPRPIEFKGLLSVMSEQMFSNPLSTERFGDRSYALVSDRYMNFSSRVGYHYSVLDSYCGEAVSKNYITFSFKGGAADDLRRNRRARAISRVLEALDFTVEVKGDMVTGRFQKFDQSATEEKLEMVGRLLQFTRQMDMLMANESSVEFVAKCFLEGNYHCDLTTA